MKKRIVFSLLLIAGAASAAEITYGPILGRLSSSGIGVWARTKRPGEFRVRYGTRPGNLDQLSDVARTTLDRDNTGWVHVTGLAPNTTYYYEVVGETGERSREELKGDFRTLPNAGTHRHAALNPEGLFNFRFEYACGNQQRVDPSLPTFRTMLDRIEDSIDFAILDGDWMYEELREYPAEEWHRQTGAERTPRIVSLAPSIVGVWENYKLYLRRGKNLAAWHREVPSFFMFDDHEMLNDVNGTGTPGLRSRRAVFRDIGIQAWYHYLGWSNPVGWQQDVHFGQASLSGGSDVLTDESADFRELNTDEAGTLTVHWGGPDAGVNNAKLDRVGGDPNAGVYEITDVVDRNRLRISPAAKQDGDASYSVGRFNHFRQTIANTEFFYIDTRSHRQMHDLEDPFKQGVSILGAPQKAWLKDAMSESEADFLFVVSSVNLMVPHVLGRQTPNNKDEAWTAVAVEREELIDFWDSLGKPVFVLTGDLHNSFAIKITDHVWEFASGPHNSTNHRLIEEANRPTSGKYMSRGRECEIRWSTFVPNEAQGRKRRPVYTVVQVNNTFRVPGGLKEGQGPAADDVWAAYDTPQVTFQYYDGLTGELLYAESILAAE
jgi:phosphodiesterase/alkaline phosphatase D-like protein